MNGKLKFNFHDFVSLQVESSDLNFVEYFSAEYQYHQGRSTENIPNVTLNWQPSPIPLSPGHDYRLAVHKMLARWYYRIKLIDNGIEICAAGNRIAVPMVHHMLVHPCLRYLASKEGVLLLHGAAVVHNGSSIILSGHGGAGKTTASSLLLAHGGSTWQLHADDYVFLADGPRSYAYLTRSHLYRDLLNWLPQLAFWLTPVERLKLHVFGQIRSWTRDGIKWPVRISAERLWPENPSSPQASLAAVVLVRRDSVEMPRLINLLPEDIPITELLEMNFYEARHFQRLIDKAFGEPMPIGWLKTWREREHILLKARSQDTPFYRLDLPITSKSQEDMGRRLIDLMKAIL
jgi:hypothetical protein